MAEAPRSGCDVVLLSAAPSSDAHIEIGSVESYRIVLDTPPDVALVGDPVFPAASAVISP